MKARKASAAIVSSVLLASSGVGAFTPNKGNFGRERKHTTPPLQPSEEKTKNNPVARVANAAKKLPQKAQMTALTGVHLAGLWALNEVRKYQQRSTKQQENSK